MSPSVSTWLTHIPVPIIVLDDKMEIVDASRSAFSMFHTRYRSSDMSASLSELSEYLLAKVSFVSCIGMMTMKLRRLGSRDRIRWQDAGRTYDVEVFTLPPEEGMYYGLMFEDITKRIEFERSRETTRNYLEQMIDSLPLGIVVVDCDMRITALNRVQQEFLHMTDSATTSRLQAVGCSLMELLPVQENISWVEVKEQIFKRAQPLRDMEYCSKVNGTTRIFSVDLIPLVDKHQEVIGAMHITEEVTEKRKLQEEAQESEVLTAKFDTLRQIMVTLNHVVNNTLTGMICNIEVVRSMDEPISNEKQAMLDEVMRGAHSIATFIQHLLEMKEIKTIDYLEGEKMLEVTPFPEH
jgi:PAS domain S-box-containing protein